MAIFDTIMRGVSTGNWNLWDNITGSDAKATGIATLMDAIISNSAINAAYQGVMIGLNAYTVTRNKMLGGTSSSTKSMGVTQKTLQMGFGTALSLLDVVFTTDLGDLSALLLLSPETQELYDVWQKALVEPNIEGIPISSPQVVSDREIDVGEQMMIVQSTTQKKYWTDNAVPHLKTWTVEGYITTQLSLDNYYISKPSLRMQHEFLDICAASRRPVLFKDNKGDFRLVQIMSLHTEEVAEYNNAIKVTIQLKEYKPFQVGTFTNISKVAGKDISSIGTKAL